MIVRVRVRVLVCVCVHAQYRLKPPKGIAVGLMMTASSIRFRKYADVREYDASQRNGSKALRIRLPRLATDPLTGSERLQQGQSHSLPTLGRTRRTTLRCLHRGTRRRGQTSAFQKRQITTSHLQTRRSTFGKTHR